MYNFCKFKFCSHFECQTRVENLSAHDSEDEGILTSASTGNEVGSPTPECTPLVRPPMAKWNIGSVFSAGFGAFGNNTGNFGPRANAQTGTEQAAPFKELPLALQPIPCSPESIAADSSATDSPPPIQLDVQPEVQSSSRSVTNETTLQKSGPVGRSMPISLHDFINPQVGKGPVDDAHRLPGARATGSISSTKRKADTRKELATGNQRISIKGNNRYTGGGSTEPPKKQVNGANGTGNSRKRQQAPRRKDWRMNRYVNNSASPEPSLPTGDGPYGSSFRVRPVLTIPSLPIPIPNTATPPEANPVSSNTASRSPSIAPSVPSSATIVTSSTESANQLLGTVSNFGNGSDCDMNGLDNLIDPARRDHGNDVGHLQISHSSFSSNMQLRKASGSSNTVDMPSRPQPKRPTNNSNASLLSEDLSGGSGEEQNSRAIARPPPHALQGPRVSHELVAIVIEDFRYDEKAFVEMIIPIRRFDDRPFVDALDVCAVLQSGPSRIDGEKLLSLIVWATDVFWHDQAQRKYIHFVDRIVNIFLECRRTTKTIGSPRICR